MFLTQVAVMAAVSAAQGIGFVIGPGTKLLVLWTTITLFSL